MMIPVVLSGGSGTRLWPLSTPSRPKQFLPLVTERTMFQETLLRLSGLSGLTDPIVVCNEAHRFLVAEQLREIEIRPSAIVLEPVGRNTAPAIAVAALIAEARAVADQAAEPAGAAQSEGPLLLVLPADHVIADAQKFRESVERAVLAARAGRLVTFGIVPTHAETGYGYIEQGDRAGDWSEVARFVEKPDLGTAEGYITSGRFLWNSGMFVFGVRTLLAELERFAPDILSACRTAVRDMRVDDDFARLSSAFAGSPSDSIDYAVMEKTDRAAVVPLDAGWSDVGSWAALHAASKADAEGNVLRGRVVARECRDSFIRASGRTIAAIGLDDIVIVETEDSVLIARKDQSQFVKEVGAECGEQDGDAKPKS